MEEGYQLPAKRYVKQLTELNAAWLARCLHAGGERTFKEGGLRQDKIPDRAGIFCPTLQPREASHWTRR